MKHSIKCDERGTIMMMGLLMTLLSVAVVYALVGVIRTIVLREGMQDAADAAAFSSAIYHAKGMNLIAFLNLLMALLVGLLIAIRMTQTFLILMSGLFYGLAWFGGATLPLAGTCTGYAVKVSKIYSRSKKVVHQILPRLHSTQEAVSVVIPFIAVGDALAEAAQYHKPAKGALALPTAMSLPITTDEFPVLCERGAEMTASIAVDAALWPVMGGGQWTEMVKTPITHAAGEIGKMTSGFLCGGSGKNSEPPTWRQKMEITKPQVAGQRLCDADPQGSDCREVQRRTKLAQPDEDTGKCKERCSYTDPYEERARRAREQCEPIPGGAKAHTYFWQRSHVEAQFTFNGKQWLEGERHIRTGSQSYEESSRPPCGDGGRLSEEWNRDSGAPSLRSPLPLCRKGPDFPSQNPAPGTVRSFNYVEATRVFACTFFTQKEIKVAEKGDQVEGGEDKSPHKMEEQVQLGGEAFQIRALAMGERPGAKNARKGVLMARLFASSNKANSQQNSPQTMSRMLQELGRFQVAQAEFYFDHGGPGDTYAAREEWLWDMRWKARLRRFRLPEKSDEKKEKSRRRQNEERAAPLVSRFGGKKKSRKPSGEQQDALSLFDELVIH